MGRPQYMESVPHSTEFRNERERVLSTFLPVLQIFFDFSGSGGAQQHLGNLLRLVIAKRLHSEAASKIRRGQCTDFLRGRPLDWIRFRKILDHAASTHAHENQNGLVQSFEDSSDDGGRRHRPGTGRCGRLREGKHIRQLADIEKLRWIPGTSGNFARAPGIFAIESKCVIGIFKYAKIWKLSKEYVIISFNA